MAELIDSALDSYTQFDSDCPAHLREAIRYALLAPGKRLRPRLVLMAAEACGASVEAALPAACAVEMIHAYSLVHDDLPAMDDDDLRRGRPTCHKAYGEDVAILVGDALLALAFEVLATRINPASTAAKCCAVLGHAAGASALVGGQAADLQMTGESRESRRDLAELQAIHRRKTGALIARRWSSARLLPRLRTTRLARYDRMVTSWGSRSRSPMICSMCPAIRRMLARGLPRMPREAN